MFNSNSFASTENTIASSISLNFSLRMKTEQNNNMWLSFNSSHSMKYRIFCTLNQASSFPYNLKLIFFQLILSIIIHCERHSLLHAISLAVPLVQSLVCSNSLRDNYMSLIIRALFTIYIIFELGRNFEHNEINTSV